MITMGHAINEEKANKVVLVQKVEQFDLIERYEKFLKLLRVVAHILKWIKIIPRMSDGELSAEDLQTAELYLVRRSQKVHFPEEFECLSAGKLIPKTSKLLSFDPQFDEKRRIIIVGGRLHY